METFLESFPKWPHFYKLSPSGGFPAAPHPHQDREWPSFGILDVLLGGVPWWLMGKGARPPV